MNASIGWNRRCSRPAANVAFACAVGVLVAFGSSCRQQTATPLAAPVSIRYEPVQRLAFLRARVNGSRPLSFVLDTGNRYAILDLARAREIGLTLGDEIPVQGGGANVKGRFVRDAAFSIDGLAGFSQPVALAIPLDDLAKRIGHDFDGILGAEFMKQFVVEIDSRSTQIRLHDRDAFRYSGSGRSVPVRLDSSGHPILEAAITPVAGQPIPVQLVVDTGATGALDLRAPFVAAHRLPGPGVRTIRQIGGAGAGGRTSGWIGRVERLEFAGFTIPRPVTVFSDDRSGSNATNATQGKIGARILGRFKLFLDYAHDRIIFEPYGTLKEPFDFASSGLRIEASPPEYRSFRVVETRPDSAATEAGLRAGDVIAAIDGRAAAELTLTQIVEMFEREEPRRLKVQRGGENLELVLTPRREI